MSQEKPALIWWSAYDTPMQRSLEELLVYAGIHQPFVCTKQDDVDYFRSVFLLAGKDITVLHASEENKTGLPPTYLELDLSSE